MNQLSTTSTVSRCCAEPVVVIHGASAACSLCGGNPTLSQPLPIRFIGRGPATTRFEELAQRGIVLLDVARKPRASADQLRRVTLPSPSRTGMDHDLANAPRGNLRPSHANARTSEGGAHSA